MVSDMEAFIPLLNRVGLPVGRQRPLLAKRWFKATDLQGGKAGYEIYPTTQRRPGTDFWS
jgi:hypothetical protein